MCECWQFVLDLSDLRHLKAIEIDAFFLLEDVVAKPYHMWGQLRREILCSWIARSSDLLDLLLSERCITRLKSLVSDGIWAQEQEPRVFQKNRLKRFSRF